MSISTAAKKGLLGLKTAPAPPGPPSFAYSLPTAEYMNANDQPYMIIGDLTDTTQTQTLSYDGRYLYMYGSLNDLIRQYEFKYPWSFGAIKNPNIFVSGTTPANVGPLHLADDQNPAGIDIVNMRFSSDGANLYLAHSSTNKYHIFRVPLSTPWMSNTIDVSSAYLMSKYERFSISNSFIGHQNTGWGTHAFDWNNDGTKFYLFVRDQNIRDSYTGFYSFTPSVPWSFANIKFDGRFDYAHYNYVMAGQTAGGSTPVPGGTRIWDNGLRLSIIGSTIVDVVTNNFIGHADEPNLFSFTQAYSSTPLGQNDASKISNYDASPGALWIQGGVGGSTGNVYIVGRDTGTTKLDSNPNGLMQVYTFNSSNLAGATYQYSARLWGSNSGLNRSVHAGTHIYPYAIWMNDYGNVMTLMDFTTGNETQYHTRVFDLTTRYDPRTAEWRGGNNYPRGYIGAYDGTNTGATAPAGLAWGNSGYKLYVSCNATDYVYQFAAKYPYSFTNLKFEKRFSIAAQATTHYGIYFKPDGLQFWIMDAAGDTIEEYNMSVAWDIGTATFSRGLSVTATDSSPTGIHFKPDGTQVYFIGTTNDRVYQRPLGTAWDISTTGATTSFLISGQETLALSVRLDDNGTRMYVVGTVGNDINYYSLGTAWTVTSAVYNSVFGNATSLGTMADVVLSSDGKDFWTAASGFLYIERRTADTAFSVTTLKRGNLVANTGFIRYPSTGYAGAPKNIWVKEDMTKCWIMSGIAGSTSLVTGGMQELSFPGAPLDFGNFTIASVRGVGSLGTDTLSAHDIRGGGTPMFVQWNSLGNVMLYGYIDAASIQYKIARYRFSTPWDLSTMIGANGIIRAGTNGSSPHFTVFGTSTTGGGISDMQMNPDGNIIVMYNNNTASIGQWWRFDIPNGNVQTLTYGGNTKTFGTDGKVQLLTPGYAPAHETLSITTNINRGITVSQDGKVWVLGPAAGYLYKWTSTTPWDFNTANVSNSMVGQGKFSVPISLDSTPYGLRVQDNGSNLYVTGTANNILIHYRLTTPYDVNTAVFVQTVSCLPQTLVVDLAWHPDGTSYYFISSTQDNVMQRTGLTVPWDPSTYVACSNVRVSFQDTLPQGLEFKTDGTQMYMLGSTNDRMYRYYLGTAWDIGTAIYDEQSAVHAGGTSLYAPRFSNSGTRLFTISETNDEILQYADGTAWNVQNINTKQYSRYLSTLNTSADGTSQFDTTEAFTMAELLVCRGLSFAKNGQRMYVLVIDNTYTPAPTHILQYDL